MSLRNSIIGVVLGIAALLGFATAPAGAETLKLGHHHAVGGQIDLTANKFADLVNKATNGKLTIKVFPAAQLGQQNEAFELLNQGVIDMTWTPLGLMDKYWTAIRVANLPFIWRDWDHFENAVAGDFGKALIDGMLNNSNTRMLGITGLGFRDMLFRGDPVTNVAGMKGLKMRSPEAHLWIRMFELLGAKPTPVTWGEVYTAMQTGVAAGLEAPALAALDMKFNEVIKNLVRTQHMFSHGAIIINKNRYAKLSPEFQAALDSAGAEAGKWSSDFARSGADKAYETMRAKGVAVTEPEDKSAWAATMTALWDEIGGEHPDAPKLIKMLVGTK